MRTEEDFIGKVEVPDEAYYGSFTARAKKNFRLSGQLVHLEFIRALALIKKCAAQANSELGRLGEKEASAIAAAADEIIEGKLDDEFVLDAFQAGAGTPLHMNVNEVIANRAEEMLGGKRGQYKIVHPNNHVNMSQSSNNVVPSAMRIACLRLSAPVITQAKAFQKALEKKAEKYKNLMKIGRTHLQDAVPMTYGQTFAAYAKAVEKDISEMERASEGMRDLGVGGTATGSGITAHPEFRKTIIGKLRRDIEVRMADDAVEMTENMNDMVTFSSALKRYACTLNRIANDLRIYSSGPKAGIAEIILPEVEPGSSIMPGKINPSVPEAVNMIAFQVTANDQAVLLAAQSGQLELNFMAPLAAHNILQSEELLANGTMMFTECVEGMEVDAGNTSKNFNRTFGYATALNPYLGYKEVSMLVTEAYKKGVSLKDLILEKGMMERDDLDKVIATARGPALVDEEIRKKIKGSVR
jgi:aspartate ammonia-lyase